MSRPILSLKKKQPSVEDIHVNPLIAEAIEVTVWDYAPEEEHAPRQRKRRKDKHIEQYRKDAKWQ